jgi:hypothetical protein
LTIVRVVCYLALVGVIGQLKNVMADYESEFLKA